jgi:hypothetical protein
MENQGERATPSYPKRKGVAESPLMPLRELEGEVFLEEANRVPA